MKLRALIVDDELHARENLKYLLENYCPEIEVKGLAEDIGTAKKLVDSVSPHVIFLDIAMPSGTEGFDFLDSIPEKKFQVIFVTAFKDYAIRALNANAIHYLQKPVDIEELQVAVKKIVNTNHIFAENHEQLLHYIRSLENLSKALHHPTPLPRITIHHAKGFKIVDQHDLMYLEGEGNYTSIVFMDGSRYVDSKSIGVYENMLEPKHFFRIHKSHIVNISCVKEFLSDNGHFVVMKNNTRLPVSRMRLPHFLDLLRAGHKSTAI